MHGMKLNKDQKINKKNHFAIAKPIELYFKINYT